MMRNDKGHRQAHVLSPSAEILMTREQLHSRLILYVIVALVVMLLAWAAVAEVDELVRGQGKVIPSSQLKKVQSLDGGILSELLVSEGDRVKRGQVLMRLDDTLARSKFNERRQRVLALDAKMQRLRAEVEGQPLNFSEELAKDAIALVTEERALFEQRRLSLQTENEVLQQKIAQQQQELFKKRAELEQIDAEIVLANKELDILKPLFEDGVVSRFELIKAEKNLLSIQRQRLGVAQAIPQTNLIIEELQRKQQQLKQSYRTEAQRLLSEVASERSQLIQGSDVFEADVDRTLIKSPVNGVVKQVLLNTLGGVVKPGADLVSIVPEEDVLVVETKVKPSDIARLYPGQKAMVKFSAYDFTVYGGLEAKLVHISADSLVDEKGDSFFLVRVQTNLSFLGRKRDELPIMSGMQAQVDILTGKKTLLSYFLKPILKAKQVALTEQ